MFDLAGSIASAFDTFVRVSGTDWVTHAPSSLHSDASSFLFGGIEPRLSSMTNEALNSAFLVSESVSASKSESPNESQSTQSKILKRLGYACIAVDGIILGGACMSWNLSCQAPLLTWAISGLALSFPATWGVDCVKRETTFRKAFFFETGLLIVSLGWLCYGFVILGGSGAVCVNSTPFLWWGSFVDSVLGLSITGTGIFCMITATVLSVMYGTETN